MKLTVYLQVRFILFDLEHLSLNSKKKCSDREMYDFGLCLILVWISSVLFGVNSVSIISIKILSFRFSPSQLSPKSIYQTSQFI